MLHLDQEKKSLIEAMKDPAAELTVAEMDWLAYNLPDSLLHFRKGSLPPEIVAICESELLAAEAEWEEERRLKEGGLWEFGLDFNQYD